MKTPLGILLLMLLLLAGQDPLEQDCNQIVAAYQQSIDALNRGDADAALELDTPDWVSIKRGPKTHHPQGDGAIPL